MDNDKKEDLQKIAKGFHDLGDAYKNYIAGFIAARIMNDNNQDKKDITEIMKK